MIDLSYLTEEEQANILRVLQRDAELRKVEEKRIRQLNAKNEIQRKNMTGEWFYIAKAKRHKDTLHGAELIQASMRKKKPPTIYERLQASEFKEKSSSFLKNAGSSIFIPPELSFFVQEPKLEEPQASTTSQKENHAQQQPTRRRTSPSSGKQRENPFNKSILTSEYPNEDQTSPLSIGNNSTPKQESLSHPVDNISRLHFSSNDHSPAEKNSELHPVAKARTISAKLQGPSDDLSIASGPRNWNGLHGNSSTPKSILKRSPSTSSNDSEILRIGVQDSKNKVPASQTIPEGATEPNETVGNEESFENNNLEKLKQVRFSTNVDEKRISQTQEHYDINNISKIGDNILDSDYIWEINKKNTGGMDSGEENGRPQGDSGVSGWHHPPSSLHTDFVHWNQEDVNAVSDTDFQSIQATNSNPNIYPDSHLPSDSSSKPADQAHELYTGEMQMEKKPSRSLDSTSNPSNDSIDKQILRTDFESPQVSDQQRPEIFQGKRVNFAVPLSKTAPAEQRLEAQPSKSQVHDRYTSEHIKATDESISKVLDWFTRSEEMPSAKLEETKSPIETKVESISKPLKTVLAKTDTEYTQIEPALFTEDPQLFLSLHYEIQGKDEQEIQLQDVQTKKKKNRFDKCEIPESMLLEGRNKRGTKDVAGIADTVSKTLNSYSNDKQQDLNQEQNEESEEEPLILKPFNEKRGVGIRENTGEEFESIESASEGRDVLPIATIESSIQESKSRPEQTKFSIEGPKIVPTKDIKKDIFPTLQTSSPTDKTPSDKKAFANAVFGKSSKKENMYSITGRSALLANKGNAPTETLSSTFPSNGEAQELAQSNTKEERSDVELNQQKMRRNKKEQRKCEEPFLENERRRQNQAGDKSANGAVSIENTAPCKLETSPSTKQNKQESNILQLNRNVNVPEVEQTLDKNEKKTEVNLNLEGHNTNMTPEDIKPFTIVSIKKRMYEASDHSLLNNTQFTNLMNFWDKGTESCNCNDDKPMFTETPGEKSLSAREVKGGEPGFPLELQPLPTQNSARVQRITQTSNFKTPEEPIEYERKKPQSHKGPTVNEIMQQLCEENEAESVKKRLDTRYFPKVLPTDPKEIQAKLKKMPDVSIEGLSPASSIFHRPSGEVEEDTEENTNGQPKLNTSNIGLHKLLQEENESEALTRDKLNEDGGELLSKDQFSMLRDGQNVSNLIKNKEEQHILEKSRGNVESLDNRIQFNPRSIGFSYEDEKIPVRQTSSDAMSSNEGNLTLFTGGSRLIEENYISQEKLNKFDSSAIAIQADLNTADVSLQEEETSPIKSDKEATSGADLDTNNKGFEFQDEFDPRLNLPSGMTSTFKDDGSMNIPTKILKSETPYNVEQEAKNIDSDYSGGNGHLPMETRSSLNGKDTTQVAWKRNPHTSETSKSLQDLNTIDSMPSALDSQNKEMVLSADDVSNIPVTPENTPLQSKKLKRLSQSVPALAENDDGDSLSEQSFQMNKHGMIASSLTNISSSPGMTSRSSVTGSIMSIYSGDFGNIDVRGKIQFSLDYVDKLKELHIFVVRCSDLAAADEKKNRSDPYVKSYLFPDKVKLGKKKTSVKKRTLNPVYNEILRYKVERNVLMAQTLNLSVWHNDTFGRNSFLGEVAIELEKWNWNNKLMEWYNLKPRSLQAGSPYTMDNKGTLKVAFRYIPRGHRGKKSGEVQIWVKEANNLPQVRPHRLDPFVKCFILPDTSSNGRQKTRVVKKNRNPNFNHTMVYDGFGPEDLKDACVELSVWDHDKLVNHFLGGLRVGFGTGKSYGMTVDWMDSTKEETQVWNKMITQPNIWAEDVLPLRMLMLSKNSTN